MNRIHSLYYHNPEPEGVEKMIRHYLRRGFHFISIEELCDILRFGDRFPSKCVFVSFDDGWKSNAGLIPVIEKYKVPICIFVAFEPLISGNFWWEYAKAEMSISELESFKKLSSPEFDARLGEMKKRISLTRSAFTVEELKRISENPLVSIQSHTVTHPILTSLTDEKLDWELAESRKMLSDITGKRIFAFSYPNGSLAERERAAVARHYLIAFSTEQNHISYGNDIDALPRYALTGDYFRDLLKVAGVWKYIKKIQNSFAG